MGFSFFPKIQSSPATSNMESPWKLCSHFGAITRAAIDLCNRELVREISQAHWQWRALGFGRGDIWEAHFCGTTTQKQLDLHFQTGPDLILLWRGTCSYYLYQHDIRVSLPIFIWQSEGVCRKEAQQSVKSQFCIRGCWAWTSECVFSMRCPED